MAARESELDYAREMSLMIGAKDLELLKKLESLPCVLEIETHKSGRISFKLTNTENSINNVISTIMENGGNVTSITTKDPSLEDVFIESTAKRPKKLEGE